MAIIIVIVVVITAVIKVKAKRLYLQDSCFFLFALSTRADRSHIIFTSLDCSLTNCSVNSAVPLMEITNVRNRF
jgi:hypothetical protein